MNGNATKEEVEKFITEYNKRIRWNREIREKIGEDFIMGNEDIRQFVEWVECCNLVQMDDDYNGHKDEDVIDPEDAEIYEYEESDGRIVNELQAYSLTNNHRLYYFVTINENETGYKHRIESLLMDDICKTIEENTKSIEKITAQTEMFSKLKKALE